MSGCRNEQPAVNGQEISKLSEFAGSPARLVWVQDLQDNKDVSAKGEHLSLMGYDSEDGKGERVILAGPENFFRPLITDSGQQIVFSEYNQQKVQVVDWSGENRRDLTLGRALALWCNPTDYIEWVYVDRSSIEGTQGPGSQRLYRVQLDNPLIEELVWDKTPFGPAVLLSGDGRYFSAEIPSSACALIDSDRKEARRYGKGCWPAVAPDQSYRFWFFDGAHRNLEMVDTRKGGRNRVHLAGAPGIDGHEVYHPRWSNHPRYMVMTGPYTIRQGGNNIRGGGAGIEIYAGRFNKDYTNIEAWFQVSNNQRADFYPDMWVAEKENVDPKISQNKKTSTHVTSSLEGLIWPVVKEKLLFAWGNVASKNEWTSPAGRFYQAEIVPEGMGRFAFNYQMKIGTGWYVAKRLPEPDSQEYDAVEAVSLEFVATMPVQRKQADGRLLSLGQENENQTILRLEQGFLELAERRKGKTTQSMRLGKLPVGKSHVMLYLDPIKVTLRINKDYKKTYPRKFSAIKAWPLVMGDPRQKNSSRWKGMLERVALYTEELDEQDIERSCKLFLQMLETANDIKPIVVRAELLSASPIPSPQDILPYRRGLVVNEYKVIELLQGDIKEQVVLVAHWAILHGETLPTAERIVGGIYDLRLDAFDNRPELEGERLSMASENLLLPMYYDIDF